MAPPRRRPDAECGTSFRTVVWLFVIASALVSFVVAAVSVGSVVARQSVKPRRAVYDLDEAVDHVAGELADEVTAVVSFGEVRQILEWHLDYLGARGVASTRTDDDINPALVVVGDAEPIAFILGRADDAGLELSDDVVVEILAAQESYYEAIGAFGPRVEGPDEPLGVG